MLRQNSKYIYFFLVFVFVFLCAVSLSFNGGQLSSNFIYLFTVLLIPIFDYIINATRDELDTSVFRLDSITLFKIILFLVIGGSIYGVGYSLPATLTLLFFVFFLLFHLSSKIPFFIALILFLYSAIYIVSGNTALADSLSIYAYYFLIIGVVLQVYHFYLVKFIPSEQK